MKLPLEGGCRCDRVRIRVTASPLLTMACHCRGCQRMSSSAFSISALFPSAALEVIQGEPVIGGLHGADTQHFFCGWCMTWMFTRPVAMPELVNVRPTMFDDDKWFAPYVETYIENRLPWAVTGAKRSFSQFPPMETYRELLAEYATSAAEHGGA